MCSQNLPDVDIIDSSENFNTVLYTGTGSSNSVTGVGFQPDWVWGKRRDSTGNHWLNDAVRGATKGLHSDSTSAEYTDATVMNAFNSDGFTVVSHAISNASSATYVAWNWLAGTAFSNSSGSNGANVDSSGQVNTTAGFSIVSWQFTSSADNLIFHGLSSAPEMMILKSRTTAYNWDVYHTGLSATSKRLILNSSGAEVAGFFDTAPTSTVFEYKSNALSNNDNAIAYYFHSVEGYSKVGSYTGNGNADGPFIYTGFRPAWIMTKRLDGTI